MHFSGLDTDALIAIGFVGVLAVITIGLFVFVSAKCSKKAGEP
jgi:hypothetical protein